MLAAQPGTATREGSAADPALPAGGMIGQMVEHAQAYTQTSIELLKLKSAAAISTVLSEVIKRAFVVLAFVLTGLLLTIGVAQWLGELLGRSYYGYFIVAGVYLLLGSGLYMLLGKAVKLELDKLFIGRHNHTI
jgi:hypothetical protein